MRLPLLAPADLTAEQETLYRLFETMVATDEFTGMTVQRADGAFLGPFGVLLHLPAAGTALARYARVIGGSVAPLSPSARQVVILTGRHPRPGRARRHRAAHDAVPDHPHAAQRLRRPGAHRVTRKSRHQGRNHD
jgi:hypothetical protein